MEDRKLPANKLRMYWSKREKDVMYWHPKYSADSRLIDHYFNHLKYDTGGGETTLCEELDRRGFDLETIRFSIAYKKEAGDE